MQPSVPRIVDNKLRVVIFFFLYFFALFRKQCLLLLMSLFLYEKVTVAVGMLCQIVASCPRLLKSEITELMTLLVAQSKYDVQYSKISIVYVCDVDFQRVFKENSKVNVMSSYFTLINKSKFCFRSPFPEY